VDDDERGFAIQRRRRALGMRVGELAKRVDVDRSTVTRVEQGKSTPETYALFERALTLAEEEMGMDEPPGTGQVEFVVEGHFGVRVRVKGPIADLPQMERSVERLIQRMGQAPSQNQDD